MNFKSITIRFTSITLIGTVLGFAFNILMGRTFGASKELDSFLVILTLFNWLGVFTNFITSLYIPIFNEVKIVDKKNSLQFTDVILKWIFFVSLICVLLFTIFDRYILHLIAPGFTKESIDLSTKLMGIILWSALLSSVSYIGISTLSALYIYSIPAIAGLLDPICNISALYFLVPTYGIVSLAYSILIANVLKCFLILSLLFIYGGWRPSWNFYHPKLTELIIKSSQLSVTGLIWSLRDFITRNIASRFGEGTITLYFYAEKIVDILIKVFLNPPATIFYSRIASFIAENKWLEVNTLFKASIKNSLLFAMFIASSVYIFVPTLLKLLFDGSKFSQADLPALSNLLSILLVYFLILSIETYFVKIIFTLKKATNVGINAIIGVGILFIVTSVLHKIIGPYCLPIGISITQAVVCALYVHAVLSLKKISLHGVALPLVKGAIVTICITCIALILQRFITNYIQMMVVLIPLWISLYVLSIRIFFKDESIYLFRKV